MRRLFAIAVVIFLATQEARANYERGIDALAAGQYEIAWAVLLPLAENGSADAQFTIGFMYDYGQGVPRNAAEALSWYRRAADQGLAVAQYTLGSIYEIGLGVSRDLVESFTWYSRAAETLDDGEARDAVLKSLHLLTTQLSEEERARLGLPASDAERDMGSGAPTPSESVRSGETGAVAGQSLNAGTSNTAIAASVPNTAGGVAPTRTDSLWHGTATNGDAPGVAADAAATAPLPSGRALVRDIQQELARLGFDAGTADGLAGRRTKAAIEAYQNEQGLQVTGRASAALLPSLRLSGLEPAVDGGASADSELVITAAWPEPVPRAATAFDSPAGHERLARPAPSFPVPDPASGQDQISDFGVTDRPGGPDGLLVPDEPTPPEQPLAAATSPRSGSRVDTASGTSSPTSAPRIAGPTMPAVPVEPVTVAVLAEALTPVPSSAATDESLSTRIREPATAAANPRTTDIPSDAAPTTPEATAIEDDPPRDPTPTSEPAQNDTSMQLAANLRDATTTRPAEESPPSQDTRPTGAAENPGAEGAPATASAAPPAFLAASERLPSNGIEAEGAEPTVSVEAMATDAVPQQVAAIDLETETMAMPISAESIAADASSDQLATNDVEAESANPTVSAEPVAADAATEHVAGDEATNGVISQSETDEVVAANPTTAQLAALPEAGEVAAGLDRQEAVVSDALFTIPRRKPAPTTPAIEASTAEAPIRLTARQAGPIPEPEPDMANPTNGVVVERLAQLDQIVAGAGSIGAISQAWTSLGVWEAETHAILETALGAEAASRLGAQANNFILGDPFGSFQSVTDAYRSYLISLQATPGS